ncbi:MAG: histidine kinase [Zoogloea sp.]|uniref:ATP-binding protein n=1 Tax=Zoogloea sp. TaxID=49181 RepID=UPI0026272952|nr:ATP-binding protein [Zoogloea sp.]MDD3329556.1 histidine kinase [Zoogloea sp.]
MLDRYPLMSRLSLMLACLASLAAALFASAGAAARLEGPALAQPGGDAAARLAGLGLIQAVLALMFVAGCGLILRAAWKALALRTDLALARVAAHTAGAVTAPAGGGDEIDRLARCLDSVAAQLAGRLADSERLSRHAREQERFAARSLEFIYRACAILAENSASAPWLTTLLEDMADCLQAHCCALALLDPVAEGLGVPPALGAPRLARLLAEFDAEALARSGGLRRAVAGPDGEIVELAVPVRDADNIYGVLIVEARGDFLFESRHRRLVDAVAGLFALSLGNLQRNQRRRRLALMDERNAIAGELHDSLAQALSYMKLQIARLQLEIGRSCAACAPGGTVLEISGEIKTGLDSAYRHLRELLSAFRTSMPPGGLQQALREVVEELSARAGTEIGLDYRLGDVPLSVNEEFHLLQIVREALTNVVRHARADHALIRLERAADGEVQLRVDDDGRGIAPGSGGDGHHGLSIMHERARQLGGRLNLGSGASGRGTCVEMHFRPRATHA